MPNLDRLRVEWAGSSTVGPAVSTFFFAAGTPGIPAAVKLLYDAAKNHLSEDTRIQIPKFGETINEATGDVVGAWTDAGDAEVVIGLNVDAYARGVGCRVVWETGVRTNSRRVRGSTFLVPVCRNAFSTDGQVSSDFVALLGGGAGAMVAALDGGFRVWTRPDKGGSNGGSSTVIGHSVPLTPSWLRSRKT